MESHQLDNFEENNVQEETWRRDKIEISPLNIYFSIRTDFDHIYIELS